MNLLQHIRIPRKLNASFLHPQEKKVYKYNKTKARVDTVNQLCFTYDFSQNSRIWPPSKFFSLNNVTGINAHVVYHKNTGHALRHRLFLKNLFLDLIQTQLCRIRRKFGWEPTTSKETKTEKMLEIQGGTFGSNLQSVHPKFPTNTEIVNFSRSCKL